ncbi:hypothetical protein LV89_01837 [Arcicella aurantiaca]|uniref:Uncharacterized protein n=1 Tax=Arcicella aurantiaca TaxID=591202 RepID=A0A316ECC4_9BACT|nr:hypothetical protein [Arcicella aurantiaca]PWK27025.1 hypothetical protein LV89_01837 [Arcicella aurantiaca]
MQVGQYVSLKSNTDYVDIYDAPTISSASEGFTAGYIGKVSKVNVAGIGESRFFTEVVNRNNEKKYIDTADNDLFETSATDPKDNTPDNSGTVPSTTPTTPDSTGGSTFDKIVNVFNGLLGIFKSTKKTDTGSGTTDNSGDTQDSSGTDGETPDPSNNAESPFLTWIKTNWLLSILLFILLPGGLILGIIALVKASKKKAALAIQNTQNNGKKI